MYLYVYGRLFYWCLPFGLGLCWANDFSLKSEFRSRPLYTFNSPLIPFIFPRDRDDLNKFLKVLLNKCTNWKILPPHWKTEKPFDLINTTYINPDNKYFILCNYAGSERTRSLNWIQIRILWSDGRMIRIMAASGTEGPGGKVYINYRLRY